MTAMLPTLAALAAVLLVLLVLPRTSHSTSLIGAKLPSDSCLVAARETPHGSQWIHALEPHSRAWPHLGNMHHGASDWPPGLQTQQEHAGAKWHRCSEDVFRYRVVQGTVYTDHDHYSSQELYWDYREVFVEQLLTAMYLYNHTFPDVELYVNMADLPVPCELNLPFMQYNVIDLRSVHAHHIDVVPSHLVWHHNDDRMLAPEQLPAGGASHTGYTRGVTLPFTHSWDRVSLSPAQLTNYSRCLDERYSQGGWDKKKPAMIWRGSPTGYQRGWQRGAATGSKQERQGSYSARALLNKRLFLAALAMRYPWMDIGITGFVPSGPWDTDSNSSSVHRDLVAALDRGYLDAEAWSAYMLQLSIDGHGAPWRLPQQLLGGSALVVVDSPLKPSFHHLLKHGVHYHSVAYDLSDFVARTRSLVRQAQTPEGATFLQHMADAAREVAVEHLGALGQLDSFMWSVLKVKEFCPWPVEVPDGNWRVLKLRRDRHWISYGTAPVRGAVMELQAANFVPAA